jgi:hypothetical protein
LHLFLFTQERVPACDMRLVLDHFARVLGLKKFEVFPKQDHLPKEKGGKGGLCITMPYVGTTFNGKMKAQVGIKLGGFEMTCGEFINVAERSRVTPEKFAELLAQAPHKKSKSKSSGAEFDRDKAVEKAKRQLAKYVEEITNKKDGDKRNARFNTAAYVMGRYVGAGLIDEELVKTSLRAAAAANVDGAMDPAKIEDMLRRSFADGKANPFTPEDLVAADVGFTADDFYAYLPMHNYIFVPTREFWPAASVNTTLGGKPSNWLDRNRPVVQATWAPACRRSSRTASSPLAAGSTARGPRS